MRIKSNGRRELYCRNYAKQNTNISPDTIQFADGHQIVNMYDASGQKYRSIIYTNIASAHSQQYDFANYSFETDSLYYKVTEYSGNIETYTTKDTATTARRRIFNSIGYNIDNTYYHYIKDHIGNICAVVNSVQDTAVQSTLYYASGVPLARSFGRDVQPYLYNGKEFIEAHGLNEYDSQARMYYAPIMRTTTMDPLAEKYYHISPYAWCGNNPVMLIDPDGLAWYLPNGLPVPTTISEWKERLTWTEYTSQETLTEAGIDGVYMGEAVVVFDGYYDEKLGKDGKLIDSDGRMPADAKMANVTVFGPNSKDDIADYLGYTMSSDPKRYGVLANGEYNVNRTSQLGPYESPWAIENRGKLPTLFDVNPAYPNRNPAFIEGVFVHKYNLNGKAGVYWDKDKNRWAGRSEGCLLIGPNKWGAFKRQLQQVNSFHLILNRQ